jgi:hypothetical protein
MLPFVRLRVGAPQRLATALLATTLAGCPADQTGVAVASRDWSRTGDMLDAPTMHSATLLPSGLVLVAGGVVISTVDGKTVGTTLASAELYDPGTGSWSRTGRLATPRYAHTATLLPSGRVLVAGGAVNLATSESTSSAELYDPITGTWSTTGPLATARQGHTATLLPSGSVLVVGGWEPGASTTPELYDPSSGLWTAVASPARPRQYQAAARLPSGRILVVGSALSGPVGTPCAEVYDPAADIWSPAPAPPAVVGHELECPWRQAAVERADGTVLLVGGSAWNAAHTTEQSIGDVSLFAEDQGAWVQMPPLLQRRTWHTATLLPSGKVLVAGGLYDTSVSFAGALVAETYQLGNNPGPAFTGSFTPRRNGPERWLHTATLLTTGEVLVAGGTGDAVAELYRK